MEHLTNAQQSLQRYFTNFEAENNRVMSDFEAIAPTLQTGQPVNQQQADRITRSAATAQTKLEMALTGLPNYRKGATGADSGHLKTALPASVVFLAGCVGKIILSSYTIYLQSQEHDSEEEYLPAIDLVSDVVLGALGIITVFFWYIHSWNARDAAKAASVNPSDEGKLYWISKYVEAARKLETDIATFSDDSVDDATGTTIGEDLRSLEAHYTRLNAAQQARLGNITTIKEAYLNRIIHDKPDHLISRLTKRVRLLSHALRALQQKGGGNLNMANHNHDISADDFAQGLGVKIGQTLDNANGVLADVDNGTHVKDILDNHPKAAKFLHGYQWLKWEGHIGKMEFITMPNDLGKWYKNRGQAGDKTFDEIWTQRQQIFHGIINRASGQTPAQMV